MEIYEKLPDDIKDIILNKYLIYPQKKELLYDIENFKNQLTDFGFDNIVSKDMWKFTHIIAEKTGEVKNSNPSIKI